MAGAGWRRRRRRRRRRGRRRRRRRRRGRRGRRVGRGERGGGGVGGGGEGGGGAAGAARAGAARAEVARRHGRRGRVRQPEDLGDLVVAEEEPPGVEGACHGEGRVGDAVRAALLLHLAGEERPPPHARHVGRGVARAVPRRHVGVVQVLPGRLGLGRRLPLELLGVVRAPLLDEAHPLLVRERHRRLVRTRAPPPPLKRCATDDARIFSECILSARSAAASAAAAAFAASAAASRAFSREAGSRRPRTPEPEPFGPAVLDEPFTAAAVPCRPWRRRRRRRGG